MLAHIAQSILPNHAARTAVGLSNSTVIRTSTQGKAQKHRCNRCFQTGHKTSTCESPCAWDAANGVCSAAVGAHHKPECGHHRIVCADSPVNRNALSRNAKKQSHTQHDSCRRRCMVLICFTQLWCTRCIPAVQPPRASLGPSSYQSTFRQFNQYSYYSY